MWLYLCEVISGLEQLQLVGNKCTQPLGPPLPSRDWSQAANTERKCGRGKEKSSYYKSMGGLGVEKVPGFGNHALVGEVASGVACSGHALLQERCPGVLLLHAQLCFSAHLDGFSQWPPGERRHFCWRNPILGSKRFFPFFRKRLMRLNKENRRCGERYPGQHWAGAQQK